MSYAKAEEADLLLTEAAIRFGIGRSTLVIAVTNCKVPSRIKAHPKTGLPVYMVSSKDMEEFMVEYKAGMLTDDFRSNPKTRKLKISDEEIANGVARRKIEAMLAAKELGVSLDDLDEEYFE